MGIYSNTEISCAQQSAPKQIFKGIFLEKENNSRQEHKTDPGWKQKTM